MKGIALLTLLLLIGTVSSTAYPPLVLIWDKPIKGSIVFLEDWNNDGEEEFFIFSKGQQKDWLYIFNEEGEELLKTTIPGFTDYFPARYARANEEITALYATDLDENGNLDILVGSKIRWTSLNVHKFYRLERKLEPGTNHIYNRMEWVYEEGKQITDIKAVDLDSNGKKEILVSTLPDSEGNSIYAFDSYGKILWEKNTGGATWDLSPVALDHGVEIFAASLDLVSLLSNTGTTKWIIPIEGRMRKIDSAGDLVVTISGDDQVNVFRNNSLETGFRTDWLAKDLVVRDFDNSGDEEIILALGDGSLSFMSKDGWEKWEHSFKDNLLSLDSNREGNKTLLVGGNDKSYLLQMNWMYLVNRTADGYYQIALKNYYEDNYEGAMENAGKCKELFDRLNNNAGIVKCDRILLLAQPNSTAMGKRIMADEYYAMAMWFYNSSDWDNATRYGELSRNIYLELEYIPGIEKSDLLLLDIEKGAGKERAERSNEANGYFIMAEGLQAESKYEEAIKYLTLAEEIYTELEDERNISRCRSKIIEIRGETASKYYEMAEEQFSKGIYDDAITYGEQCRKIYEELNQTNKVERCNSIINLSGRYIKATELYNKAVEFFNSGSYGDATISLKGARGAYIELNHSEGILKCDSLLKEIKRKESEWTVKYRGYLGPLALIIVAIISIAVYWRERKGGKGEEEKYWGEIKERQKVSEGDSEVVEDKNKESSGNSEESYEEKPQQSDLDFNPEDMDKDQQQNYPGD